MHGRALRRCGLRASAGCEISGTRAHDEMIVARRFRAHLNCAEGAVLNGVRGRVRDGVLIANIAGNLRAERNYFANRFRLEKFAAGSVRDLLQCGGIFVEIGFVEKADGIDDSVGFDGERQNLF